MLDESLYHQVADYLQNRLPEDEARQIRARIGADKDFALEVEMVRLELDVARRRFDLDFERQMAEWDAEAATGASTAVAPAPVAQKKNGSGFPKFSGFIRTYWAAAAAITAIAIAVYFFVFDKPGTQGQVAGNGSETESEQPQEQVKKDSGQSIAGSSDPGKGIVGDEKQVQTTGEAANEVGKDEALSYAYVEPPHMEEGNDKSNAPDDPLAPGKAAYQKEDYREAYLRWEIVAAQNADYQGYAQHGMANTALKLASTSADPGIRQRYLKKSQQMCESVLRDADSEQVWLPTKWTLMLTRLALYGRQDADFKHLLSEMKSNSQYRDKAKKLEKELQLAQ